MPAYRYRAVHASGRIAKGSISAANENELAHHLSHSGLELIEAHICKNPYPPLQFRLQPHTLTLFTGQLLELLRAKVPFVEAVRNVQGATSAGPLRDALAAVLSDIEHGSRIGAAFARHPRIFPPVFISILAAGDISGDLTATFEHLMRYTESRARLNDQLRRALRYPLFLLCITFAVTAFMMSAVVPKIIGFLNTIDSQLPLATRVLISVSEFFSKEWLIFLLTGAILSLTVAFLRRTSEKIGIAVDALLLRLPVIGGLLKKLALARFVSSFAILFHSNVGIPAGLRGARATLGNRYLEMKVKEAERQVINGSPLSSAVMGLLPVFAIHILLTGERSGRLGRSLDDIAATYEREVSEDSQKLVGALEPTLTLLIGGMLAWIVLAILGPIYGSVAKLGGMG